MIKKIEGLEAREKFYQQIADHQLTLGQIVKMMRAIVGMTGYTSPP